MIRRKLADKRTWELIVLGISMLGSVVEPRHWGMILSAGFVIVTLVELLVPDVYDSTLDVKFVDDEERSWDTLG